MYNKTRKSNAMFMFLLDAALALNMSQARILASKASLPAARHALTVRHAHPTTTDRLSPSIHHVTMKTPNRSLRSTRRVTQAWKARPASHLRKVHHPVMADRQKAALIADEAFTGA